jgi:hypothetical protein
MADLASLGPRMAELTTLSGPMQEVASLRQPLVQVAALGDPMNRIAALGSLVANPVRLLVASIAALAIWAAVTFFAVRFAVLSAFRAHAPRSS